MKNLINLLPFIAFLFSLQACQKEISKQDEQVSTGSDSIYVSKIYCVDVTETVPDTFGVYNFSYDDRKRVTKITDKYSYESQTYIYTYEFNYFDDDTLPDLTRTYETLEGSTVLLHRPELFFYYFNDQDQLIKDSFNTIWSISANSTEDHIQVHQYSYSGNAVYVQRKSTIFLENGSFDISFYRDTITLDNIGNIISYRRYSESSNGLNDWNLFSENKYTYDNSYSPFSILNIRTVFSFQYLNEVTFFDYLRVNNKLTSEITEWSDNLPNSPYVFRETCVNEYFPNGLLKESVVTQIGPDPLDIDVSRFIFEYTALD